MRASPHLPVQGANFLARVRQRVATLECIANYVVPTQRAKAAASLPNTLSVTSRPNQDSIT
jgi:hypothetical protein